MTSRSGRAYGDRAKYHSNAVVKKLFDIAESKKTNVVLSADLTTSKELLDVADRVGPHIAVLKTHIDVIEDFDSSIFEHLQSLAKKHNFLIFEDRKFIDIGNTVQKQYHGGALRITEWADIVNCSILAGPSIVDALAKIGASEEVAKFGPRGLLILAEMTSKDNLAGGEYTKVSVEIARNHPKFVIGFVANNSLSDVRTDSKGLPDEDFVVFTTGVNRTSSGDALGQQYKTPAKAVAAGADFIIAGRGIYADENPVESAKYYQQEGWEAYLGRISKEKS